MKKWIVAVIAALLIFMVFVPTAFAAGAPPSNAKKGEFSEVDAAGRTAVFKPVDSDEPITLKL
ncbi:MAG TPA: hypothetical protein VE131_03615, partial [Terriglobales bacterium]|nr:hypothetical protein [Terriglobales bacterium]